GYLRARGALPGPPLTAMVPMARRGTDQAGSGGNAVSTVLATLATDVDDPVERLVRISASARAGKARFAGTTTNQSLALSALSTAGVLAGPLTGWGARPPFNVVDPNQAGPAGPRWWDGARLDEMYPVSVPVDGQALNISVLSSAGRLGVGLTACARSVPDLPRLVDHLDEALRELEGVLA
ncbi:MAG: WS/DGAT domain-containing protein, partial [Acidimicrobiia bacterium]